MSEIVTEATGPRRRADAERSIAAVLDAAVAVLSDRPDASVAQIAAAAGVSRQTVYAHYPSREALLRAVADRALTEALAAIDAAQPHKGPPAEALDRLVVAWWDTVARHARVLEALAPAAGSGHAELRHFHAPILERLERLVRRGQRAGAFERRLPAAWLAAAFLGLMHTTAEEVAAGRLDAVAGAEALRRTIPRVFGVGSDG